MSVANECPKCGAARHWKGLAEFACGSHVISVSHDVQRFDQSDRCRLAVAERERDEAHAATVQMRIDTLVELAEVCRERDEARAELDKWRPLTNEEAQKAYDEAEAVPLSQDEIDRILEKMTDPAVMVPNDEHAKMVAHIRKLMAHIAALEAEVTRLREERDQWKELYTGFRNHSVAD